MYTSATLQFNIFFGYKEADHLNSKSLLSNEIDEKKSSIPCSHHLILCTNGKMTNEYSLLAASPNEF